MSANNATSSADTNNNTSPPPSTAGEPNEIDPEQERRTKIANFLNTYGSIISVVVSFAIYLIVFKSGGQGGLPSLNRFLLDPQEKVLSLMILNGRIWTGEKFSS